MDKAVEARGPVKLGIDTGLITWNNADKELEVSEDHPANGCRACRTDGFSVNAGMLGANRDPPQQR